MSNDPRGESPTAVDDGNPLALLDGIPRDEESRQEPDEEALQRLAEDGCPITG